ncbi:MAG: class I SAM-dependent methyltransferase [Pontiellaceae bacterium]
MPKVPSIHELYEAAVQYVETDLNFGRRVYKRHNKMEPKKIREDFCGTALLASCWAQQHSTHTACGIDLHQPTLDWGRRHHLASLTRDEQARIDLRCEDVLTTQPPNVDIIFALNFSFCVFKQREQLLTYFKNVRSGLKKNGLFILDIYGGTESIIVKNNEVRDIPGFTTQHGIDIPNFEYIWDQAAYNPINHHTTCHIHFNVPGIKRYTRAFTYHWRLWTLPELCEIMQEAGFSRSEVYLHDFDENGESDECFRLRSTYENAEGWIAYLVGVTS